MSKNMLSIRNALITDLDLIVTIGKQTQLETFLKDNKPEVMEAYLAITFSHEKIKSELLDINSSYFITEMDGIPVGYFKIRRDNHEENKLAGSNAIELQRIYVLDSHHGRGIGKFQLDFCLNLAKKEGYSTIWLGVWEKNLNGMAFYQKMGFEIFTEHIFDFGGELQNDLMMKKAII